jgi:Zn-finger nucleic acid-binding protein
MPPITAVSYFASAASYIVSLFLLQPARGIWYDRGDLAEIAKVDHDNCRNKERKQMKAERMSARCGAIVYPHETDK